MITTKEFEAFVAVVVAWFEAGLALDDCEQAVFIGLRKMRLNRRDATRIASEVMAEATKSCYVKPVS